MKYSVSMEEAAFPEAGTHPTEYSFEGGVLGWEYSFSQGSAGTFTAIGATDLAAPPTVMRRRFGRLSWGATSFSVISEMLRTNCLFGLCGVVRSTPTGSLGSERDMDSCRDIRLVVIGIADGGTL